MLFVCLAVNIVSPGAMGRLAGQHNQPKIGSHAAPSRNGCVLNIAVNPVDDKSIVMQRNYSHAAPHQITANYNAAAIVTHHSSTAAASSSSASPTIPRRSPRCKASIAAGFTF